MTDPEIAGADEILRRLGIGYVVVGGQAIARKAATTTRDVDVMVATADFKSTIERLRKEPGLACDWVTEALARFRILALGGVPLDILNAATFSGTKPEQEFFGFLREEASFQTDGIAYATPEAVWYTRLLTKRWKAYAEKIVTNVVDGLPEEKLGGVASIAERFGTKTTVDPRLAYVREELSRPDVRSLIGTDAKSP